VPQAPQRAERARSAECTARVERVGAFTLFAVDLCPTSHARRSHRNHYDEYPSGSGIVLDFSKSLFGEVAEESVEEVMEGGDVSDGVVDRVTDTLEDET